MTKPDIIAWQKTGSFYVALTKAKSMFDNKNNLCYKVLAGKLRQLFVICAESLA